MKTDSSEAIQSNHNVYGAWRVLEDERSSDSEQEEAARAIDAERTEGNWIRAGFVLTQMSPVAIQRLIAAFDRLLAIRARWASPVADPEEEIVPDKRTQEQRRADYLYGR